MAPASRARSTRSRWLKAVRMTTGAMRSPAISPAAVMPSILGILTSQMTRSGSQGPCLLHRGLAVADLADDVVSLLGEHLAQVQADEGLVLRDEHTPGGC